MATWNIREFGRRKRMAASIHYIAEILNQFDLIAVTEVRDNLKDLETFQDEIRQFLSEEIVNRYYYQAGRILAQIQEDKQLDKAVEILNEPALVKEVLSGNKGDLAIAAANR